MQIGTSIFLIALGAILYYAVNAQLAGIEIQTVGVILMIVGVIGLVISLLYAMILAPRRRADREVVRERERL
jgi:Co/Zn/Cd efflux system component